MTEKDLQSPFTHPSGAVFKNRIVLAPLTRGRAGADRVPKQINIDYYTARAGAGLVITEATAFTAEGHGWAESAGFGTPEQREGWKKVVKSVHAKGSLISLQLWHTGRASHSSFQLNGASPVGASAIAITGETHTADGSKAKYEVPRPLKIEELKSLVKEYAVAAKHAAECGFDFVEVHSANGYLLDSFLQPCSNTRTDEYGGSKENRFRLVREIIEEVIKVYPSNRLAIRLSPNGSFNSMGSPGNFDDFTYFISELHKYGLAYLHVMDGLGFGYHKMCDAVTLKHVRSAYPKHPVMGNCGYTKESGDLAIANGDADFIAFGRPYLSNPDLAEKFRDNVPLAPDLPFELWYSHDAVGYTDLSVLNKESE